MGSALAAGTPAGTLIENFATATYNVGPSTITETSNTVQTTVDERIEVDVTWIDATSVPVAPGDLSQVTTFEVTNLGNGTETITLGALSALGGDDFDPALVAIHLDTNTNGTYDPGTDLQYVATVNDPVLLADETVTVFVLNNIPGTPLENDEGFTELTASSNTGTGLPGTVLPSAGDGGVDAVIGSTGGEDTDTGIYVISTVIVSVVKNAVINDPLGGSSPIPGSVITYTIVVTVTGTGTASNLIITDDVPAATTYDMGTLSLNAGGLTDNADGDAGDVTAGTVTVDLGNVAALSPIQTISFDVTIN
jgi:uncharacterized repeat protein (TIGR01451 family)